MEFRRRATVSAMALVLMLAACSGDEEPIGGAEDLPPPLAEGVVFADVTEEAPMAPEFTAELIDGTEVEMAELWADRPVVMVFTASWCPRCPALHQEIEDVVAGYDDTVALIGIADEEDEGVEEYATDLGIRRPMAVVPITVWDTYAVNEPPLVALVGPGGKLMRGWPGGVDPEVLAEQLDELTGTDGAG